MEDKIIPVLLVLMLLPSVFLCGCSTNTPGTLDVTSFPAGAGVFLDSQFRGSTPCTINDVSPGNHTVELHMGGYQIWRTTGTMDVDGYASINATLVSIPR